MIVDMSDWIPESVWQRCLTPGPDSTTYTTVYDDDLGCFAQAVSPDGHITFGVDQQSLLHRFLTQAMSLDEGGITGR